MMKHKNMFLSIIVGINVICLAIVIASGVIRGRSTVQQPNSTPSFHVIEITQEIDPAIPTLLAAFPTATPSNELVEQVHVRFILTADEATANEVLAKLKSGASWDEMCKQYSLDKGTIQTGCDLGWFHRGVMIEEFEDLVFDAPVSEFRGPERIKYGWVIIQVLGHEMRPYS